MADSFTVTPTPYVIFRGGQDNNPDTLVNLGTDSVWVDTQPQVTNTQGFELTPSAMYPVEGKQYLSVVCPTSSTVQLLGRSGLNFWDPNQIATAINLIGVPPIDKAKLLYDPGPIGLALGSPFVSPVIDLSSYNSYTLRAVETNGAAGSVTTAVRQCAINWYADAAGTQLIMFEQFFFWPSGGQLIVGPSGVRGPYAKITFNSIAVGAATGVITTRMYGSFRTVSQNKFYTANLQTGAGFTTYQGNAGLYIASGSVPVGVSKEFPFVYGGPAILSMNVGPTTTANSIIGLVDPLNTLVINAVRFPINTASQTGQVDVIIPPWPVVLYINNGNAAAWAVAISLTMDGNRY